MARGSNVGNPRGYFGDYARRGLSQNAAVKQFRADGGRGSNEFLRNTYNEVRGSLADQPAVARLPGGSLAGDEHYLPWKAGRPGRYAYGSDVYVWDEGIRGAIKTPWTIMSDVPLTPDEAAQMAQDEVEEGIEEGGDSFQGQRAMFSVIRSLHRTV